MWFQGLMEKRGQCHNVHTASAVASTCGALADSRAETLHWSTAVAVWLSCHKKPQWALLGVDRGFHQLGGSGRAV